MKRSDERNKASLIQDDEKWEHANLLALGNSGYRSDFSKGYLYTLEALIVITLVLVTIAFIFNVPSQQPELEISNLKHQGYEALEYLDKRDELRRMVYESDENELKSHLKPLLSKNLKYEVNICKENCSATSVTANETVVGIKYYVAEYKDTYLGKKVILWMWRKI